MLDRLFNYLGVPARPVPPPDLTGRTRAASPGAERAAGSPTTDEPEAVEIEFFPAPVGVAVLESAGPLPLRPDQQAVIERVERRVDQGDLDLPLVPATSAAILNLASNPGSDIEVIARMVASDPTLASELLRAANSGIYGARLPVQSVRDGVVRLGMRSLRSLVLALAMRAILQRSRSLLPAADAVWRQASSVGELARLLAGEVGIEGERGFSLGLLHDVGKAVLLPMLARELPPREPIDATLVSQLFLRVHEPAGAALAAAWNLGDELVSVARCHHRFQENADHPRSAALVLAATRVDACLARSDETSFWGLATAEPLAFLGLSGSRARGFLRRALECHRARQPSTSAA